MSLGEGLQPLSRGRGPWGGPAPVRGCATAVRPTSPGQESGAAWFAVNEVKDVAAIRQPGYLCPALGGGGATRMNDILFVDPLWDLVWLFLLFLGDIFAFLRLHR